MKNTPPSWQVVATVLGGILLSVIAWEVSRAVDSLREIERTLAVAVQRVEDHERRIGNLETLFLKPER